MSRVSAAKKKLKTQLTGLDWEKLNNVQEMYDRTEKKLKEIHKEYERKEYGLAKEIKFQKKL